MSILDNIGAGTSVNGTFELKILYSNYFDRYHIEKDKNGNLNLNKNRIINLGNPQNDEDAVNKQWLKSVSSNSLIFGDIKNGIFNDLQGDKIQISKPMIITQIVVKSTVSINIAYVAVFKTGSLHFDLIPFRLQVGINTVTMNLKITPSLHSLQIYKGIPGFNAPGRYKDLNGKYKLELSTLVI